MYHLLSQNKKIIASRFFAVNENFAKILFIFKKNYVRIYIMICNIRKKPILIGIIGLFLTVGLLFLLLLKPTPDPYSLLGKANGRIQQNICRMAILEERPEDEAIRRELLLSFQQYADPLTLYAALQQAEAVLGHPIDLPQGVESAPRISTAIGECSTIAQRGVTLKEFPQADGLAVSGDITYLSTQEGIYAHYKGVSVKISPRPADKMIPAEEGVYFLDTTEQLVKYLAGDGSYTAALSYTEAKDYGFLNGVLYILGTDGRIYADNVPMAEGFEEICILNNTLYASKNNEIYRINEEAEKIASSFLSHLTAGEDGALYYLNKQGYPCRFKDNEASILKEKEAAAIGQTKGTVYYLDLNGKIRKA